jgi:hypothetical protein
MSDNPEILIIWHSRRLVPRPEVLLFTAFINERGRPQEQFKNASNGVCISNVVVYPDPLPPTPLTSSAMKSPENTEEDPDGPEPADVRDIQMEYPCD